MHENWTDSENDAIVEDYFAMLAQDFRGESYSKAEHNRILQAVINRPRGSIEYKHQNISAVLKALGEDWIPGYKPAFNFQSSLVDAVVRWLAIHPDWLRRHPAHRASQSRAKDGAQIWIGPAPTMSNQPPPLELDQSLSIARQFGVAERDAKNRALGEAGEERALFHERATLSTAGRADLAKRVIWVSREQGDGAGYDIASFEPDGLPRLIEVKTTNGWDRTPFYISRNEIDVAHRHHRNWVLLRLWNFRREPKAFELRPPLDRHLSLTPSVFQASFQ